MKPFIVINSNSLRIWKNLCWFCTQASVVFNVFALGFRIQDTQDASICKILCVWGGVELQCQPEICLASQWLLASRGGVFNGARCSVRGRLPLLEVRWACEYSRCAYWRMFRWTGGRIVRIKSMYWVSCFCFLYTDLFQLTLSEVPRSWAEVLTNAMGIRPD